MAKSARNKPAARKPAKKAKKADRAPRTARAASVAKGRLRAGPASRAGDAMVLAGRRAIDAAVYAHETLHFLLQDFPAEQRYFMPTPTDPHLLWQIGHLTTYYSWSIGLLGEKAPEITKPFNEAVGYKSVCRPDPGAYPHFDEVLAGHNLAWKLLMAAAARQTASDLATPLDASLASYAKDRLGAIERIAWHDGWHSGQVSGIRRALKLPPKF